MKPSRNLIFLGLAFLTLQVNYAQQSFQQKLADSALTLTQDRVQYDPSYFSIEYPMGDVPAGKGVCTDVVIRAYRKLGIDLQQKVHEDMKSDFDKYPRNWVLTRTDSNIDHRRVPNLQVFFSRKGTTHAVSRKGKNYLPGDIVTWDLGHGLTHIGIVSNVPVADTERFKIIHNIGSGQVIEDVLFNWKITGHYRYDGR